MNHFWNLSQLDQYVMGELLHKFQQEKQWKLRGYLLENIYNPFKINNITKAEL